MLPKAHEKKRKRAPSQRSLQTRERVLDAAELLFAERGFEGASIRDIAARAGVQAALVQHHGRGKEALFHTVVARRAEELAAARKAALQALSDRSDITPRDLLGAFVLPFLDKVRGGGPQWAAYGRLIAYVSADARWRPISEACFDPTAELFLAAFIRLLHGTPRHRLAAAFVFSVSSMLAVAASQWRIEALAGQSDGVDPTATLLDFCAAGFVATVDSVAADKP